MLEKLQKRADPDFTRDTLRDTPAADQPPSLPPALSLPITSRPPTRQASAVCVSDVAVLWGLTREVYQTIQLSGGSDSSVIQEALQVLLDDC